MDSFAAQSVGWGLLVGLVTILILGIYSYSLSLSCKPGVPNGPFWQLPFVGETLSLKSGTFEDFLRLRIQRYGRNFRTHLLGDPCIVATNFDTIKFVLQSPLLFKRLYSKAVRELMAGEVAGTFCETKAGYMHRALSREAVKQFIPELDKRCRDMLARWEKMQSVPLVEELEKFAFIADCVFNCDHLLPVDAASDARADKIKAMVYELRKGLMSLPVDIPGTAYHKAKGNWRSLFEELLPFVIRRRAEKGVVQHYDMLDVFVKAGETMTDAEIVELLIGFLFAGVETSASFLTWVMIDLMSSPEVFALLREENERVAEERRSRSDDSITYSDLYEKLIFTNQVIKETLRTRNIAAFIMREAVEDVVHEGMVFPKGWKVVLSSMPLHADPKNHSNPEEYNPSRFSNESASKPEKYLPFGMGPGYCKGQEAFKVEAVILLHHLMANYEFKSLRKLNDESFNEDIIYWPSPRPGQEVRITLSKRRPEAKI